LSLIDLYGMVDSQRFGSLCFSLFWGFYFINFPFLGNDIYEVKTIVDRVLQMTRIKFLVIQIKSVNNKI